MELWQHPSSLRLRTLALAPGRKGAASTPLRHVRTEPASHYQIQQAALIVIGAQECAYEKRNIDGVEYSSTEQVDTRMEPMACTLGLADGRLVPDMRVRWLIRAYDAAHTRAWRYSRARLAVLLRYAYGAAHIRT
eukprot:600249-Rhodomonas_salina.1